MHPDLVRTTGLEIDRSECRLTEAFHDIPMRHRVFARWRHAEPEIGDLGAADRRVDGGLVLFEVTLRQSMVGLHHLMFGELAAHLGVGQI